MFDSGGGIVWSGLCFKEAFVLLGRLNKGTFVTCWQEGLCSCIAVRGGETAPAWGKREVQEGGTGLGLCWLVVCEEVEDFVSVAKLGDDVFDEDCVLLADC